MHMALRDILDMIFSVIKTAQPVDILDILVLSYVVYLGMKLIRETRAGQLIKGIFLLLFVYIIASWINMKAISYLLSETLNIGLIALIILFQPELRRTLEKAGYTKLATLRTLSEKLMTRIHRNYRFIIGFNSSLLLLGLFGIIAPTTSAFLHNASTMAICARSMTPMLEKKQNSATEEDTGKA